ncbi:Gfo/Idh/MocA family oxidoreductase [Aciduricibacillus chroicocephali]|uniref:Gfo/Idh/MocA family oxidoreductase n=1 Tax=Aciduricibacillus chroicocephali TaxID=3054939 RepID=A0ABY9KX40_9BACI|nr:Gfo/Idh/MocA family oxidoreductase [Bacillaceae bacterium 44XB]
MENIAIIGAGQLGSRHLQAISLLCKSLNIFVVDPCEKSLEIANKRFLDTDFRHNKNVFYFQEISRLPNELDFVIIATSSIPRLGVLKQLLGHAQVKYLLLEKFLFPHVWEYKEAEILLEKLNTKTYVNCTRRAWPFYHEVRKLFLNEKNIVLTVEGANWNLASNAIHFIDIYLFLTNESDIELNTELLDNELQFNKRPGYIELTGTLQGRTPKGKITLSSINDQNQGEFKIKIESINKRVEIDEFNEKINIYNKKSGENKIQEINIFMQSHLTNTIYEQLKNEDDCKLVTFKESMRHHLTLLKAINDFLGEREGVIT